MNHKISSYIIAALLIVFFACRKTPAPAFKTIPADVETAPVQARTGDDAADDPAIWVNPADSSKSVVIGTVKKYGLEMYDLRGQVLHSYKIGNPNNVDVRYGFPAGNGGTMDLVACSDRSTNEVLVFKIDPEDFSLSLVNGGRLKSALAEVYGICFYKSLKTNTFYIFLNGKDGSVEQYRLAVFGEGGLTGERVRSFKVSSQPEGMVADDWLGFLYLGEEDRGIWKVAAEPGQPAEPALLAKSDVSNPNIAYDIEGLAIFPVSDSTGYLVASSQGNNSYAVFERQGDNSYLGSFAVGGGGIDGSDETDGLEVTARNLGAPFMGGMLVVQDGDNRDAAGKASPQNFKFVAWEKVAGAIRDFEK